MTGPSGPGPDASRGDTVLVTGASGFVGRELVSCLRAGKPARGENGSLAGRISLYSWGLQGARPKVRKCRIQYAG